MNLPSILTAARRRLALTKAEVHRRCVARRPDLLGWHDRAIAFWEEGSRVPTLAQFSVLATVLELTTVEKLSVLDELGRQPTEQATAA